MPLNLKKTTLAVNTEADALAAQFNDGYLRIYDGTQPADADDALGSHVLLAELRFGNPAFPAAAAGVLTANAITSDASANATGTATWYRALKSDGTTKILDGSAGTSSANLVLNSTAIQAGALVAVSSFVHTVPKS